MLRSAILPGWGQITNGKYLKAGIVVAGEGFFVYKAWSAYQDELDASAAGDSEARDDAMNLKVTYIWWGAIVYLLQIADAYVDANLSTFDAEFGPDEADGGAKGSPRVSLALRTRF